jgi:hypothetical protein
MQWFNFDSHIDDMDIFPNKLKLNFNCHKDQNPCPHRDQDLFCSIQKLYKLSKLWLHFNCILKKIDHRVKGVDFFEDLILFTIRIQIVQFSDLFYLKYSNDQNKNWNSITTSWHFGFYFSSIFNIVCHMDWDPSPHYPPNPNFFFWNSLYFGHCIWMVSIFIILGDWILVAIRNNNLNGFLEMIEFFLPN